MSHLRHSLRKKVSASPVAGSPLFLRSRPALEPELHRGSQNWKPHTGVRKVVPSWLIGITYPDTRVIEARRFGQLSRELFEPRAICRFRARVRLRVRAAGVEHAVGVGGADPPAPRRVPGELESVELVAGVCEQVREVSQRLRIAEPTNFVSMTTAWRGHSKLQSIGCLRLLARTRASTTSTTSCENVESRSFPRQIAVDARRHRRCQAQFQSV
jgi:hypothetical protein